MPRHRWRRSGMWQSWHWTPSRANRLAFHSAYVFSSSLPFSAKPSGANWWQLWQNSEERNAGVRVNLPPAVDSAQLDLPARHEAEAQDDGGVFARRSEEHTSELQSHSDLVCRLLLEKKK